MPHATTGVPPCTLMMNHGLQTHLDLFKPNIAASVHTKQACQKQYSEQSRRLRVFEVEQEVLVRNFEKVTVGSGEKL